MSTRRRPPASAASPESPYYGVRPGTRHRQLIRDLMALGRLAYLRDRGVWALGPYTARTAKEVVAAAGRRERLLTVAERRAALEDDRRGLGATYRRTGQVPPRDSILSDDSPADRVRRLVDDEGAVRAWRDDE